MRKQCVICGSNFNAIRNEKTCSDACRKLLNRIRVRNWRRENPGKVDYLRFKSSIYQAKKYHEYNDRDDPEVEYIPAGWHQCKECGKYFAYSQYENITPDRIPYCPRCGLLLLPDNYMHERHQRKLTIGVPKLEAIRDECVNIDFDAEAKKLRKMIRKIQNITLVSY